MNNEGNFNTQDNVEKIKKKNRLVKGVGIGLISLIVIICVIVGMFLVKKYYSNINKVEYDNYEIYQYFAGKKVEYKGKVTIERNNKITSLRSNDEEIDLDNIPIYFQKITNQVMFPVNMSVVYLNNKTQAYRINFFTKIESEIVNEEESAFVYYQDKKVFLVDSIIYDGDNLYLFPYSTTIIVNDEKYELSPLSYVLVDNTDTIEIYDKENDKYTIIDEIKSDVIGYCKKYKINLSKDMILYDDSNRILRKNIDKLELFESSNVSK